MSSEGEDNGINRYNKYMWQKKVKTCWPKAEWTRVVRMKQLRIDAYESTESQKGKGEGEIEQQRIDKWGSRLTMAITKCNIFQVIAYRERRIW